jgi:hypothetical protein
MTQPTLEQRFEHDADRELQTLIRMIAEKRAPVFFADMDDHFRVAKAKPPRFRDHGSTLGLSLGGTNTKAMIASMRGGTLVVEHVHSSKNPEKKTAHTEYLDGILMADERVRSYLHGPGLRNGLGFSAPMAVVDGVPFHRTKVPTVEGLIERNLPMDVATYRFEANLTRYLASRGYAAIPTWCQGDGIVAHHGAVSQFDLDTRDKSVLLICGTGLATGDEQNYVQMGIAEILAADDALYPPSETENRQLHYAVAGKGLFGLMRRAVELRAAEAGSALAGLDLGRHFANGDDSRTVIEIWSSSLRDGGLARELQARLGLPSAAALRDLQDIAARVMRRAISSMANTALATIVKMGRAANGQGHFLFFEGGIATHPDILPRMKREIVERAGRAAVFAAAGSEAPLPPRMECVLKPLAAGPGVSSTELAEVDISLIGAVTSMMAEECRRP